jgi:phenylalanine-4-hydroxylase
MSIKTQNISVLYSAEDHATWARYYARQKALVSKLACKEFQVGFKKLALDPKRAPEMKRVSRRIHKMSGWTLSNAGNKNVPMKEWFVTMRERSFPVTDYIRKPEDFDYTAKPDLLHEYFGHLPFFTDKNFADMAHAFGVLCERANKRQLIQISRIWSLGVEFGLIREKGKVKLLGAGLLSSYGETLHAKKLIEQGKIVPFDLKKVIATPGRTYELHKKYYVVDNIQQISDALREYGRKEALV